MGDRSPIGELDAPPSWGSSTPVSNELGRSFRSDNQVSYLAKFRGVSDDATQARFPELKTGYESYYLRMCAPEGGLGIWIRYTVQCAPGLQPTGSLWCTLFDADAPCPLASKLTVPGPTAGVGDDWIGIGDARLGAGSATGEVRTVGAPQAAWNLQFTGDEPFWHLSRSWMYRTSLPRTKPMSIHPLTRK